MKHSSITFIFVIIYYSYLLELSLKKSKFLFQNSRISHSIRNTSKGLILAETRCNKCLSSVCGVLRISTESFHDIEGLHRIPLIPASTMNRPYASISHRRRTGAHARRISRFNSRRNDPGREEKRKGDGGWAKRGRRRGRGKP